VAAATNAAPTVNAVASAAVPTAAAAATQAAGSGGGQEASVTGQVTKVDANARTFTVRAADGKEYDFTATTSSRVDFAQLAADLASSQQITVTYRGTTSPYEVVEVR
jgi:hypothetical protein